LELLDPAQNNNYLDHYLDVPVDLSNVLFVCTANDEGAIPGPLRDRMDIIRLSGYDIPEKVAIARQYLLPKALQQAGLSGLAPKLNVTLTDGALDTLVRQYCRESGVRNLERHIEKLARKVAFNLVKEDSSFRQVDMADANNGTNHVKLELDQSLSIEINETCLEDYLGKPSFTEVRLYSLYRCPLL
jgi:Lon-like ATP-dependent protease